MQCIFGPRQPVITLHDSLQDDAGNLCVSNPGLPVFYGQHRRISVWRNDAIELCFSRPPRGIRLMVWGQKKVQKHGGRAWQRFVTSTQSNCVSCALQRIAS